MKAVIKFQAVISMLLLSLSQCVIAGQSLLGHWACHHGNDSHSLRFISANQLNYDGEVSNYMLMFGAVVVEDDEGVVSYPINLQEDELTISNPDGSITQCQRGRGEPKGKTTAQPSHPSPQARPAHKRSQSWPTYVKPSPPPGGYTGNETGLEYLVWKFAGRWDHVSSNTLTNLYFKPDGTYEDAYEAGYSGQMQDQYGYQTGHWGAVGSEQGVGHWRPEGTLHEGKIYITKQDGSQTVLGYKIQYRHGEYYPGEYYFNGKLYSVKYIYQ